jgi:hypothetical protein
VQRSTTSARRFGVIGVLVTGLLLSDAAAGHAFSRPWDAAHMPATISAGGITAQAGTDEAFDVRIGASVSCPNGKPVPIAVAFYDPSGGGSVSLGEPCALRWAEYPPNSPVDFSLRTFAGVPGVVEPSVTFISAASTPFVYEVSSPAGVIARGALLATTVPPRVIDERRHNSEYFTLCVAGRQEIRSMNHGDRYCEVGGGTNYTPGNWPSPPGVRKPRYPALTLATAPYWTEIAVEYHFGYKGAPQQYRASGCASRAGGRFSCNVAWRAGLYAYAGPVRVGDANVYTGRYKYVLRIVRTDVRTHERRTFVTG